MRWILYAAGGLGVLIGSIAGIGAMLPVEHVASRSARYRQSPGAVFEVISGPPDWRPGVQKFETLAPLDGRRRFRETDRRGDAVTYEVVDSLRPRLLTTRIVDKNLPYGGTWTFEIREESAGSRLRVPERGEVYNVIFRFLSRFVFGHSATIEQYLRELGAKFGEATLIEG